MSQSADLIGVTEAAALTGKSRATIKRLALSGALPVAKKMPGETGAYLFLKADVKALAKAGRAA
jgi:predicted DNA-binding transcriptional regulator AlpA